MSNNPKQKPHFYEFGPFRLEVKERLLFRGSERVQLPPKVLDTLFVLIENRGRLLEKGVLMDAVWPDTFVEEASLAQNISLLRKALGDDSAYIETLPKRGYRFTAEVREVFADPEISDDGHESPSLPTPGAGSFVRWRAYALVAIVGLGLIATAAYYWKAQSRSVDTALQNKSIAVLPFKTLGADDETDLAGLGMADALILRLVQSGQVTVLPTSSVIKYLNHQGDALAIGRELGVDAVLDGTVQRTGDRVRVTAQLVTLPDGKTIWATKFDDQASDLFVVQDAIADQLAQSLPLDGGNKRPMKKRFTENAEAYELYSRGLYFWTKRTGEGLAKAIEYFTQATEKDPNYALAYASLADTYLLIRFYRYPGISNDEAFAKAKTIASKAIELDPALAEAHAVMATVKTLEGETLLARDMYRRAIDLNPNLAIAHMRYGYELAHSGQLESAIYHMSRAHQLDPLSPAISTNLSAYFSYAGRYDEAAKYARSLLEIHPDFWQARLNLGEAYEGMNMFDAAEEEYKKIGLEGEAGLVAKGALAYVYAVKGKGQETKRLLAELEAVERRGGTDMTTYQIAQVYIALNQPQAALAWLRKAADSGTVVMPDFRYSAKLNPLRQHPQFQILEYKVFSR